jgi:hypothetical protein
MGKRDSQFIMILDIDRVFSAEELAVVRGQEQEAVKPYVEQEAVKKPQGQKAGKQQLVEAAA